GGGRESQHELGLGVIENAGSGRVTVYFAAADERLTYAAGSAPLRRVTFVVGDKVRAVGGTEIEVLEVEEDTGNGLMLYVCEGGLRLPEGELAASSSGARPEARLKAARPDENRLYELRQTALKFQEAVRGREVAGFLGGRISLVPHQLSIASEVAGRFSPRVLLADEVGLGKTIEACLILHRMILTGRAERVLILVPDALVHQWFVELLRRFELKFSLFDEERCLAIEGSEGARNANTFYEEQLILAPLSWLAGSDFRQRQVIEARWDMLIVDEAHHLEWSDGKPSEAYQLVAVMADRVPSVLLLTATPEQLGVEGHFGRLRLLDMDRFSDFGEFQAESAKFQELSPLADALLSGAPLDSETAEKLSGLIGAEAMLGLVADDSPEARRRAVRSLVDLHGTGRVFFRNRREALSGFPERRVTLLPLEGGDTAKLDWLVGFLREDESRKLLVILKTREGAEALDAAIREAVNVKSGLFHEGLTLIQRDRAAAWFAEPDGARLLICSEIGSEGRNFQFCHHLVLFDLPEQPDLLEQRIGRLDRIGQTEVVKIFVPFVKGSDDELLARWYHEGLAAFERPLRGGRACIEKFGARLAASPESAGWGALIEETVAFRERIEAELEQGRDHLLELSSFDRERAARIVSEIEAIDAAPDLEQFVLRLCDHLGVHVEDHERRTYFLRPDRVFSEDAFAGLPPEGATVTFDRARALEREEITFLTWDHPMVLGALELLLGGESGNCGFVHPAGDAGGGGGLVLEVVYVLESLAPKRRHADRFLPPTLVHTCVDHAGAPVELPGREYVDAERSMLAEQSGTLAQLLPPMMEAAASAAEEIADGIRSAALRRMATQLQGEIARLKALEEAGSPVPASEIRAAEKEALALEGDLAAARLRVDSVRLIVG
ncbi:MAG: SNF2-related protein, partial [Verrucomicrobiales bacterium]